MDAIGITGDILCNAVSVRCVAHMLASYLSSLNSSRVLKFAPDYHKPRW